MFSPRKILISRCFQLSTALLFFFETFSAEYCAKSESSKMPHSGEIKEMIENSECSLCLEFTLALKSGNITALKYILTQNETQSLLNFIDPEEGNTVLMTAAVKNQEEIIDLLLSEGADPDARGLCSRTSIMMAASLGNNLALIKLLNHPKFSQQSTALVVRKPDNQNFTLPIDLRDKHGRTALLWACYAGQLSTAQILVDHGANIDMGDHDMRTPLMWAATSSRGLPIVELLLSKGADILRKDISGANALYWAKERGNPEIISAISRKWHEIAAANSL